MTGMRKIQPTTKDYDCFVKCLWGTGYSLNVGIPSDVWNGDGSVYDPIPTFEQFTKSFKKKVHMEQAGEYELVYQTENGQVVAYANISVTGNQMEILEFIVDREQQLKGYGRKFYGEIEKNAKENGIQIISLIAKGYGALAFWHKMGFHGGTFCNKYLD